MLTFWIMCLRLAAAMPRVAQCYLSLSAGLSERESFLGEAWLVRDKSVWLMAYSRWQETGADSE